MRDGFVRVAAASPDLRVADAKFNASQMLEEIRRAEKQGVNLLVFPELSLTGYTAGDLFGQDTLQRGALEALKQLAQESAECSVAVVAGLPISDGVRLYNCACVLQRGKILGVVPKTHLPNYREFYELRHFSPGFAELRALRILGQEVPFSSNLIFRAKEMPEFSFAVEICEDLWAPRATGVEHALAGANILVNPSASDEAAGKREYRRQLVLSHSARLVAGYVYAGAGTGESTQDLVFSGHRMIAENGVMLAQSEPFSTGMTVSEIDVRFLRLERQGFNAFREETAPHFEVPFSAPIRDLELIRKVDPMPFVPADAERLQQRAEEILAIQAQGLCKRIRHTGAKKLVLGVSGGLDSTLALIVSARALELAQLPPEALLAVTMPCFGTTSRTRSNAETLARLYKAEFREIPIGDAVLQHFRDIGLSSDDRSVTYENSQARERTQVLMDLANQSGALVVGTGDLSELALGWATYNGDHMSMYAVNSSIPKTLIRYLVNYAAQSADSEELRRALLDVLDTPVSPELLPPEEGEIAQKTEDLVGPYALHDFFLYHFLRRREAGEKILRLAGIAFRDRYDAQTIKKWYRVFVRRFFSQQFKRSCMPDGPKVGSVALSPRGDWRMPSDAESELWQIPEF
ncbi:MAG TPA: NAD(+) synthase [Candidatus Pullichristensenella excrementigallinarum]|uniref:Glutamine-dependent NAD(+) synthetase n=1 Tax=Candidatus Pullichristensenella excrementigallinarum TaxID=2840907 RepID=A0A9D1I980_9FIRM|nr:NAD(+) synthase [Candidatus Pullichristensenella excrementigallinarum]